MDVAAPMELRALWQAMTGSTAGFLSTAVAVGLALVALAYAVTPQRHRDWVHRFAWLVMAFVFLAGVAMAVVLQDVALAAWLRHGETIDKFVWTLIVLGAVLLVSSAAKSGLVGSTDDVQVKHKVRRTVDWLRTVVIVVAMLVIWGARVENLGVFLGIIGAGLALSLQEILLCLAGWGYIVMKKPMDIGDRIEIGGKKGDVIDVGVFQTTMIEVGNWVSAEQSTGRMVTVPNSAFMREAMFNYTKGFPFIWNELTIIVTFESDWRRAKTLLLELSRVEDNKIEAEVRRQIEAMQESYAIMRYRVTSSIVYTSIADNGVALTLRYLTPVRARRTTTHQICEGILDAFATEANIDFAYPTTRFYENRSEGKVPYVHGQQEG